MSIKDLFVVEGSGGRGHRDRRWLALGLVCLAQFMVVLDVAIVTLALPAIKRSTRRRVSVRGSSGTGMVTSAALTFSADG